MDIAKANWKVGQAKAEKAIDENTGSYFESEDNILTIDLGEETSLKGFTYTPMQARYPSGFITNFIFEVSADGQSWKKVASGEFSNIVNSPIEQIIRFDEVKTKFIRLKTTDNQCVCTFLSNRIQIKNPWKKSISKGFTTILINNYLSLFAFIYSVMCCSGSKCHVSQSRVLCRSRSHRCSISHIHIWYGMQLMITIEHGRFWIFAHSYATHFVNIQAWHTMIITHGDIGVTSLLKHF